MLDTRYPATYLTLTLTATFHLSTLTTLSTTPPRYLTLITVIHFPTITAHITASPIALS